MSAKNNDDQDANEEQSALKDQKQSPPPTILSWTIRGISIALILSLLGYFAYRAIQPQTKPDINFAVEQDKIEQRGKQWAVPVVVTNEGDMSVHALKVSGTLTQAPEQPEKAADILLLGPWEEVSVTLWFEDDPRSSGLEMAVNSYLLP